MDATRLAIDDLFNAAFAQATVQRLVDAINAQAAALERLTQRVTTLETTQRHAVAAQHHALEQTDAIVQQIETLHAAQTRAAAERKTQQTRVDELVVVASREATRMEKTVGQVENVEMAVKHMHERLERDVAPLSLVHQLQEEQDAVYGRLGTIETRVDGKLDKSEMRRLDGVITKIQAFAPTAAQLTTRFDRVEDTTTRLQQQIDAEKERTNELSHDMDQVHVDLAMKVDAATWHAFTQGTLQDAVDQLHEDANATSATVNELVHRGVSLETSFRTLSSKLTSVSAAITNELETLRSYIKVELEKKLDSGENDSAINEIRHELGCKAWRKDTLRMHDDLQELMANFSALSRQVALSTRFLDWYATRGEAYERNLNIVENQLERLAFASAPQLREPYENQVRF